MQAIDDFLTQCDEAARLLRIKRSTLSGRLFRDGKRLQEIAAGGDVGVKRLERARFDLLRLLANAEAYSVVASRDEKLP